MQFTFGYMVSIDAESLSDLEIRNNEKETRFLGMMKSFICSIYVYPHRSYSIIVWKVFKRILLFLDLLY